MDYVIAYIATAIVFLGIDAVWLGVVAGGWYFEKLGPLLREKPNFAYAGVFYLLFVAGVVILAVMPAVADGSWTRALFLGAVLGAVAYGTYDMTNLSTLKGYPVMVAAVDMAWGTALTAVSAVAGYFAVRLLGG